MPKILKDEIQMGKKETRNRKQEIGNRGDSHAIRGGLVTSYQVRECGGRKAQLYFFYRIYT
jgi:hypothetical protein